MCDNCDCDACGGDVFESREHEYLGYYLGDSSEGVDLLTKNDFYMGQYVYYDEGKIGAISGIVPSDSGGVIYFINPIDDRVDGMICPEVQVKAHGYPKTVSDAYGVLRSRTHSLETRINDLEDHIGDLREKLSAFYTVMESLEED